MASNRRDLRRRLFQLAASQGGYFSAAQAKTVGYSHQAQAYHVQAGNWRRIDRGLFRLTDWVPDLHDDLIRWTLWSRGRAVVSHLSALNVDGVGEFESAQIHLTVPPEFSMSDPAVILHHANLPEEDVFAREGFKVTSLARSLVDVASLEPDEDQLARAIEEALGTGLVTARQLRQLGDAVDPVAALRIERALHRVAPT